MREDFGGMIAEREDDGGAVFFKLAEEKLVAEVDAVEHADGEGDGGGEQGNLIKAVDDQHRAGCRRWLG